MTREDFEKKVLNSVNGILLGGNWKSVINIKSFSLNTGLECDIDMYGGSVFIPTGKIEAYTFSADGGYDE